MFSGFWGGNLDFIKYTSLPFPPPSPIVAVMAEWLRRWTRNPMGYSRAGSNPVHSEAGVFLTLHCLGALCRVGLKLSIKWLLVFQQSAPFLHCGMIRLCHDTARVVGEDPFLFKIAYTRSGVRTHADICPLDLKSNALTTRPSWWRKLRAESPARSRLFLFASYSPQNRPDPYTANPVRGATSHFKSPQ